MVNMSMFLLFPIIHLLRFYTLNLLTEPHSHIPRRTRPFLNALTNIFSDSLNVLIDL